MRERGSGTIVNITSIAGRIAALAQSPYVASKWALEGVSEGMAQELAPFGVRVAIVEPGVTKSAIFAKNIDAPNSTGAYDRTTRRMFQFYAAGMANATDPFEVGRVIHHAITTDEPQLRYPVSWGGAELCAAHDRVGDDGLDRPRRDRLRRRRTSSGSATSSDWTSARDERRERAPIRILTVCSHNRTRSVMIAAMLQSMLDHATRRGRRGRRLAGFGRPTFRRFPTPSRR